MIYYFEIWCVGTIVWIISWISVGRLIVLHFFSEMVVPEIDKKLLEELESMGFPTARATRALHFSGELLPPKIDRITMVPRFLNLKWSWERKKK